MCPDTNFDFSNLWAQLEKAQKNESSRYDVIPVVRILQYFLQQNPGYTFFMSVTSGLYVLYDCHIRVAPGTSSHWSVVASVLWFSIRSVQLRYGGACFARFGGPSGEEDVSKDNMAR